MGGSPVTLDQSTLQPISASSSGSPVTLDKSTLQPINQQQPGLLSRAWDWATKTPILDNVLPKGVTTKDIVRGAAFEKLFGESYIPGVNDFDTKSEQHLGDSPTKAAVKTFIAGAAKDTADMGTSVTTPVGIGTMALGPVSKVPGAVGTAAKVALPLVSAAFAGKGAKDIYEAGTENTPEAWQQRLGGAAQVAGGAAGVANVRAIFGPAAAPTNAEAAGAVDTQPAPSSGAAHAVEGGAGGGPAVESAPGAPVGRIARTLGLADPPPLDLLTKAIKPLASNNGWNKAIASAAPDMKLAEADLGHPITGIDDALEANSLAKKGIWAQYAAKLQAASAPQVASDLSESAGTSVTIDGNAVADAMMKSIDNRTRMQNPDIVERIQKVADTYRRPMGLNEAEDFLQSANNDLHSYYAKNKVGQQVAQGDPSISPVVAEANQLRSSLYSKLDELTGPGAADLKQRYGALSNVQAELLRRQNVAARQQPDSLAEQIGMARAFGKIAVGTLRGSPSALLEGVQSLAAAKYLKARGLTDNMITRAFQALGRQPAPTPAPPPVTPPWTATGAGVGNASVGPGGQ
jgi:hypothetical protein